MGAQTINGVRNFYGPRTRFEGIGGSMHTQDAQRFVTVLFDGANYTQVSFVLPAGTTVAGNAMVEVTEAFALGGTTPTINIGVSGSHGTNYLAEISEAQAEAVGTYSVASAGTLAVNTPVAAATTIIVGLDGTSPTITSAGKCKVVIPIRNI